MMEVRALIVMLIVAALTGCHSRGSKGFWTVKSVCHAPQPYQSAADRPPLRVPPGFDAPNTLGSLVIPPVEAVAPPRGPNDPCLEEPPRFKAAPAGKAASQG